MHLVITESSVIKCAHQGTINLIAIQSKLTINGNKVLANGYLNNAMISLCTTNPDPNTKL